MINRLISSLIEGHSVYIFEKDKDEYIYHYEIYPTTDGQYKYALNIYNGFTEEEVRNNNELDDIFSYIKMYVEEIDNELDLKKYITDYINIELLKEIKTTNDFVYAFNDFLESKDFFSVYIH